MQTKASQIIKPLVRADFYEMLFELEMILRPKPTQRDEDDAQEFLRILIPDESLAKKCPNNPEAEEDRVAADQQEDINYV